MTDTKKEEDVAVEDLESTEDDPKGGMRVKLSTAKKNEFERMALNTERIDTGEPVKRPRLRRAGD